MFYLTSVTMYYLGFNGGCARVNSIAEDDEYVSLVNYYFPNFFSRILITFQLIVNR
jgi:hypothetical protein